VRTAHANEGEVPQRVKRHQMKCRPQFVDGAVMIAEIGGHPAATYPCVRQPGIKCQRPFESPICLVEPIQQYKGAAA
jgi:hypothetical protein